jgi:hypothetical protein
MKNLILMLLLSFTVYSQVNFPHPAPSAGSLAAERVANFTVGDAGNDRLEIANGTKNDGQFVPTFWTYRESSNSFSMVFTSSIKPSLDNGASPLMLFTTTITPQVDFTAPATGDFPWGPSGTYQEVVNRPLFEWRNSSSKIMTIIANGNVGIGTTTPTARLHNRGSVRFQDLANGTIPAYMLGTDSDGNVFEYPVPSGGGDMNDVDWLKPDGTVAMSINDNIYTNGNVGINVQNPSSVLHTNGTVKFQNLPNSTAPAFILGTDSNGNVFEYPVPGGSGGMNDADWLKPDGTVAMSINDDIYTNGFVGFNVQNPTANIHAMGSVRFQNLANGSVPAFMLGTDSNGNVLEFPIPAGGAGNNDADWLKLDGTIPMAITDNIYTNGKVGINTNVLPSMVGSEDVSFYSLYVKGGILTEEVRVALVSDWADYVFMDNYDLPSLKEVEEHIKEKGHLINIPSENEVKNNGVDLLEMNKKLLEKVEELTLYMIEMNKQLELQRKEIEELKNK